MRIKQAVVERFVMLCEEAKIKPNELATISGVTPSTVYSMLDPSREDVYITTIKKLCDGLGINIADFFNTREFHELEQEIK
jgi:DNA-binding Xre family transcriptional regulator